MFTTVENKLRLGEKLHGAAQWLVRNYRSVFLMGCGMSPIGALCLTIFGLWSLRVGACALILPATIVISAVALRSPTHGKMALVGFLTGILAVIAYDAFRLWFVWQGWWGDFIPKIGGWLLGRHQPDVLLGYTWRWLGNGGGMGMTCVILYALAFQGRRSTVFRSMAFCVGFGVVVWGCLIVTLVGSARGQAMLFHITPLTLLLSLIGHLVYGACIGLCSTKLHPWLSRDVSVSSMRGDLVAEAVPAS
jgi:hypothetical protein